MLDRIAPGLIVDRVQCRQISGCTMLPCCLINYLQFFLETVVMVTIAREKYERRRRWNLDLDLIRGVER
jgi:hypothetical protein